MENLNYKYTTLGLAFVLILTYAWHWDAIFNDMNGNDAMNMGKMGMNKNMHMMPDGKMMSNDMQMGGEDNMDMMDMSMNDMTMDMQGKKGKDLEKSFLTGMVPHHQGAVDMARLILADKTVNPAIAKFAQDIINAQESEIKMMNTWLKNY